MSAYGYKRTFTHIVIYVRFTPESRHTKAQCPLLGLKQTIFGRALRSVADPGIPSVDTFALIGFFVILLCLGDGRPPLAYELL